MTKSLTDCCAYFLTPKKGERANENEDFHPVYFN
jgi:hypothetical protein